MNIKNRQTAKFALILAIIALMAGLSSCDRVHEIIEPETFETDVLMEERDHVWVVDQNGVEVPVPGTWVLVSHTHLNSNLQSVKGSPYCRTRHTVCLYQMEHTRMVKVSSGRR